MTARNDTVTLDASLLRRMFGQVYFINGTAYAGKSTAARLLAERFDGICCRENYHEALMDGLDPARFPNLCYFQTMAGWQAFLNRAPEEYARWTDGVAREAAQLEILLLARLTERGKPVFVDTNIPLDMLRVLAMPHQVAILLSAQDTAVQRFFERSDPEKQFLLRKIAEADDPVATMANFRRCIALVNSPERWRAFRESGFYVLERDESRTPAQTAALLARHFGLEKGD